MITVLYSINQWDSEEVIVNEISLEDFAMLKRFVIDESYQVGKGLKREEVELYLRECDSSVGYEHSVEMEEAYRVAAVELDRQNTQPKFLVRNSRRFYLAETKLIAAQDHGDEYNYMKDRTLFQFPFDETNYRNDLLREARKQRNVSQYPMAERYVSAKYIDRETVEERQDAICEQLKQMYDTDYTYEDLMRDNWRSNG